MRRGRRTASGKGNATLQPARLWSSCAVSLCRLRSLPIKGRPIARSCRAPTLMRGPSDRQKAAGAWNRGILVVSECTRAVSLLAQFQASASFGAADGLRLGWRQFPLSCGMARFARSLLAADPHRGHREAIVPPASACANYWSVGRARPPSRARTHRRCGYLIGPWKPHHDFRRFLARPSRRFRAGGFISPASQSNFLASSSLSSGSSGPVDTSMAAGSLGATTPTRSALASHYCLA